MKNRLYRKFVSFRENLILEMKYSDKYEFVAIMQKIEQFMLRHKFYFRTIDGKYHIFGKDGNTIVRRRKTIQKQKGYIFKG